MMPIVEGFPLICVVLVLSGLVMLGALALADFET